MIYLILIIIGIALGMLLGMALLIILSIKHPEITKACVRGCAFIGVEFIKNFIDCL